MRWLLPLLFVAGLTSLPRAPLLWSTKPWRWTPPPTVNVGDLIEVPHDASIRKVFLSGREMTFSPQKSVWLGVAPHGNSRLFVLFNQPGEFAEIPLKVHSPPLETANSLRLPASVWQKVSRELSEEERMERERIRSLTARRHGKLVATCWKRPLSSRVTSHFASPRQLPNGRRYYHTGEDLRAVIGTKVQAAAPGRVVYVGQTNVSGRLVILEHGDGWFSRYLHLKESKVQVGDVVNMGQVIALSGASGRVEAPHLHWEILWRGIPARPDHFLPAWEHLCDPKSV